MTKNFLKHLHISKEGDNDRDDARSLSQAVRRVSYANSLAWWVVL